MSKMSRINYLSDFMVKIMFYARKTKIGLLRYIFLYLGYKVLRYILPVGIRMIYGLFNEIFTRLINIKDADFQKKVFTSLIL